MHPSRRAIAAATTLLLGLAPLTLSATAYADTPSTTSITERPNGSFAPGEQFEAGFTVHASTLLQGESVHITRFDATHPTGEPLPDATIWGSNAISLLDTAPMSGSLSYQIDYPGDTQNQPATATFTMPVTKLAPRMLFNAPASSPRTGPLTIQGGVMWPNFNHVATGQVHASRTDPAHPGPVPLGTLTVAADGTFTLHDTPTTGGPNTYTFTYDGGTSYLPVTQSVTVQITRADTSTTITTDRTVYAYGDWTKITAHLGTSYNNRTLTITAHPAGGHPTTLTTGTTDAHGNLTAWYKLTHNTTFSTAFTGDYRYNPTSADTTVYTHAQVTDTMLNNIASTRIGGIPYTVYMRDTPLQPLLSTTVTPDHTGQRLVIVLQRLTNGAWHTIRTDTSTHLKGHSSVGIPLPWNTMPNYALYRVVAQYTHDNTDISNINTWGNWQYFTVHPHP